MKTEHSTQQYKEKIISYSKLAPSAHNTQPFSILFKQEDILIMANPKRLLPIADPHNRDFFISLGAYIESINIALLDQHQVKLVESKFFIEPHEDLKIKNENFKILCLKLHQEKKDKNNHLSLHLLNQRFTFRGLLTPFNKDHFNTLDQHLQDHPHLHSIKKNELIKHIAKLYDDINYQFIIRPGYLKELYYWMRFSKKNPRWSEDGMNAESLSLHPIESFFARYILKPAIFNLFKLLSLGKLVITEAPKVKSSQAIVAITANKDLSWYEQGKVFLKSWLELTELNFYGAPLSLLVEDPTSLNYLKDKLNLNDQTEIINILRIGNLPENYKVPDRVRIKEA